MKKLMTLALLLSSLATFAFETPKVIDANMSADGNIMVQLNYEKAVNPFFIFPLIEFPVKHLWTKIIECPNNHKGDTTAKIGVTVKVKDDRFEVEKLVPAQKLLTVNMNKFCKGSKISNILINETIELNLPTPIQNS